jgi:hypothetical protein
MSSLERDLRVNGLRKKRLPVTGGRECSRITPMVPPGSGDGEGPGPAASVADDDPLEAAIDGLFALPLAEFTPTRNALAKQLEDRGDAAAAKRVKAFKKPGLSAGIVNGLWWTERERFDALLRAVATVGEAQRSGAGPEERAQADRAKRDALRELMQAAQDRLTAHGHAASAGTLRRISTTLEAIAARGADTIDPPPGRLAADLDPPGFDLLASLASMAAPAAAASTATPNQAPTAAPDPEAAALERAREAVEAAQAELAASARATDEALRAADRARAELEARQDDLQRADAELESARQRAERLRKDVAGATRDVETATATLAAAQARTKAARTAADAAKLDLDAARR